MSKVPVATMFVVDLVVFVLSRLRCHSFCAVDCPMQFLFCLQRFAQTRRCDVPTIRSSINLRSSACFAITPFVKCDCHISRHIRNRRQHSTNGNKQQHVRRCKWESTSEMPGIALCNPDELQLPKEAMMKVLRVDQVSDKSSGISFCNSLLLKPKLRVRSDGYLASIV